jgi:hypothetical protein
MALRLQRAVLWIATRLTPPALVPAHLASGLAWSHALGAVVRAGVADALEDPETADSLGARLNLHPDLLHRTLRVLAAQGVFRLGSDGRFSHTAASRALQASDRSGVRDFVIYFTSSSNVRAWERFEWTLRTGDSAFEHVHGMSVWDWFERHPDERDTFARAMSGLTRHDAPVVARLYPFAEIRCVCDVGGGAGLLLSEILIRHPGLRGILCDRPGVLQAAQELLAVRGLGERVQLAPGSFFEQVPAGADAYLLKNVLHDWDDETCGRILQVIRRACRPGDRLLLAESLVTSTSQDLIGTASDLQMAVACSRGRERDGGELHDLAAASGFRPGRIFTSPIIAVVEAIAAD